MGAFSINTNLNALLATGALNRTLLAQQPLFRSLSTGFAINSGRDGPARLISSQSLIASLRVLEAQSNALTRSRSVLSVADAALGEVSDLLLGAEVLTLAAASTGGLSDEEREAYQLELDSIVQSIDRILSTTSFAGTPLFDGKVELSLGGHDSATIPSLRASELGETEIDETSYTLGNLTTGQALDLLSGDPAAAAQVAHAARTRIDLVRGELGAADRFTIEPRLLGLQVAIENTAAATSLIVDTNFASATAQLSRLSILSKTGLAMASMANTTPLGVLGLLTRIEPRFGFFM